MHFQATMKDGTLKLGIQHDKHGPAVSHSMLDPAQVAKFEIVEGGKALFTMAGLPRNYRQRSLMIVNQKSGDKRVLLAIGIVVLPNGVTWVFNDGRVVKLPDFLPAKMEPGTFAAGRVIVDAAGNVTIDGAAFPFGYQYFTPIDSHAAHQKAGVHHHIEQDWELRPGPQPA